MENIWLNLVLRCLSVLLDVQSHQCPDATENLPLFVLEQGDYFQNLKLLTNS